MARNYAITPVGPARPVWPHRQNDPNRQQPSVPKQQPPKQS